MDMKNTVILGGCIVAAALVVTLVPRSMSGSGPIAREGDGPTTRVHSPDGNLKVEYSVQTTTTTAQGGMLEEVSAIEFYATYVVVRDKHGGGRFFNNEQMRQLNWWVQKR